VAVFTSVSFSAKLDSKGRITVPAEYRKRLDLSRGDEVKIGLYSIRKVKKSVKDLEEALKFISSLGKVESFSFNGKEVEAIVRE